MRPPIPVCAPNPSGLPKYSELKYSIVGIAVPKPAA